MKLKGRFEGSVQSLLLTQEPISIATGAQGGQEPLSEALKKKPSMFLNFIKSTYSFFSGSLDTAGVQAIACYTNSFQKKCLRGYLVGRINTYSGHQ